ncbi:copper-binding protein [Ramlibacter sp.]|uniref:copper-binding protein n=1 Tax=Ramlibacter sp. TaxID=1917967 RepID=UPI002B589745|nr:copper-binding protein [Ramlibacter sp.]HWI84123.1 copper-binding protein [Ramlibacter sp.]
MKTIHTVLVAGALGAAAVALPVQAQGHDHHGGAAAIKPVADKAGEMSEGEVRKVDVAAKKITLKHGPLKNLDMPPMTMAFQVQDPALLAKVKAGDKVRFVAANPGGRLTITQLEVAK